jgi:predicted HNH restriction endonuclease
MTTNRKHQAYLRRSALREKIINSLGGKCCICGYTKCLSALEGHHIDPVGKEFSLSTVASWKRIEKELDKCMLLCANCHREVHSGFHLGYITDEWDLTLDMEFIDT